MHYMGFVFVDEPTVKAVEAAMEFHDYFDFFQFGWQDGRHELGNGHPDSVEFNYCRTSDLPQDLFPYFFVAGDCLAFSDGIEKITREDWAMCEGGDWKPETMSEAVKAYKKAQAEREPVPGWEDSLKGAIEKYNFVVVVNAHC